MDDTLADAHTSLGYINVVYEWDWPQAEQQYRRAIKLNSNYATAHHWYAYLLMVSERFEEAERELRKAQALDPLSLIISGNVGFCLYFQRRNDEAIEQLEKTVVLDAALPSTHYYLGLANEQKGLFEQSLAELRQSVELSGGVPGDLGSLGHAYASSGKTEEARRIRDELLQLAQRGYVTSFHVGLIHLRLGDVDVAFHWFDKALQERDFYLIYLKVDPRLDRVRSDLRFAQLLQRVGLPG